MTSQEQGGYVNFSSENLMPQEEMLEVGTKKSMLTIGIPKEDNQEENRIALVPDAVSFLVDNGHRVLIETGAGTAVHFSDNDYSEAGGEIAQRKEEVFVADIILKVGPLSDEEIGLLRNKQTILSSLHLAGQRGKYFKKLMAKRINAVAFENIRDKAGAYPIIRAMSKIVGNTAIVIASEYLSNPKFGKGSMLGGFPGIIPTEIVILGAGTVAENAARIAIGMGALVKVFDNSIYKLERLQNSLNNRIFTSIMKPKILLEELKRADVVIGAMHSQEGICPCIVTEDMVKQMKSGSVIVDVSIDQGGCFETSQETNHKNPVFKIYDVTHYCVPNIASRVPHTSSNALSNLFTPILQKIGDSGGLVPYLKNDYGFCQGVYMLNGKVTNQRIAEMFNLPFQDLNLLLPAID